jgi:hypothetical protein
MTFGSGGGPKKITTYLKLFILDAAVQEVVIKRKSCPYVQLIMHSAKKTYGGVDVWFHVFFGDWSA